MKIAMLAPGGFDRGGRARIVPVFLDLVERLSRQHSVHVFTLYQYREPERYRLAGATIHNIGYSEGPCLSSRQVLHAVRALREESRVGPFDLLHGLWATDAGLAAAVAGRLMGIPSVVTVAGGELVSLHSIGYGGRLRLKGKVSVGLTLRLAGTVTCAAEYTLRTLVRWRPDASLIPLGADTVRFTPPGAPPPAEPKRLLHVASLNRVKDQPTLLRAFHTIRSSEPSASLDVIGEDTLGGSVQALAHRIGVAEHIHFRGYQEREAVAASLRRSHLLLHSSLFEDAGPLVFLEAAACGVATAGTSVGLIHDLAPHAASATPTGDSNALADAAIGLLQDPNARERLAQRAHAWALVHNADWTAERFNSLYIRAAQASLEAQASGATKRAQEPN